MAQAKLRDRRSILKIGAVSLISGLGACVNSNAPIAFSLVFESPLTNLNLQIFDWPNMRRAGGLFGRESGLFLSPRSPKQMSFMAEEIQGLPEWFDLGWHSPLLDPDLASPSGSAEDLLVGAKFYTQRIPIKSVIPATTIEQIRKDKYTMLYLRFIFSDSTVKFDFYTQKWK